MEKVIRYSSQPARHDRLIKLMVNTALSAGPSFLSYYS